MILSGDCHFVHRVNRDGTTDSICKYCYVTVCTSTLQTDLAWAEREHMCDPNLIARWEQKQAKVISKLA